jgi:hypothetical protein
MSGVRAWIFLTARVCAAATGWLLLVLALGAFGVLADHQTDLVAAGILFVALVMWRTPRAFHGH